MKPGKELDALVAEKVMGWKIDTTWLPGKVSWLDPSGAIDVDGLPHYSTDIAAAWEVVEKLKDKFNFVGPCYTGWNAVFVLAADEDGVTIESVGAVGETAPHAICLAALQVVGVKV